MTNSDTMFLTPYFSTEDNQFQFTREQASHFAKKVAADFNPIHEKTNKRFCVPGDLLLAVLLQKEGISQKMRFDFSAGMVGNGIALEGYVISEKESSLVDEKAKSTYTCLVKVKRATIKHSLLMQ